MKKMRNTLLMAALTVAFLTGCKEETEEIQPRQLSPTTVDITEIIIGKPSDENKPGSNHIPEETAGSTRPKDKAEAEARISEME